MTHGIFLRPGVVDAIDTYGRPVEPHDTAKTGVYWDAEGFVDTQPAPVARAFAVEPGAVITDDDAEDWWRNHVDAVPMRDHPDDEHPMAVFVGIRNAVLLTLGAVIVGAVLARVFG